MPSKKDSTPAPKNGPKSDKLKALEVLDSKLKNVKGGAMRKRGRKAP
ncbi:MAG: hypothetical protein NTW72_01250 [Gemmatimonadetes bacterium]|nr:hypothetical protein [Gemmatimonadota bacterium]